MKLIASCKISQKGVLVNGQQMDIFPPQSENWKKTCYSNLELEYPKFHKMDPLAKMTFLSSEILKKEGVLEKYTENELALLFANNHSSLATDLKYIDSYTLKGSPSPSLFVYTLPNILTGELAIRNKWYGENCFFIEEKFDPKFFLEQINFYFSKGSNACLCGWVESNTEYEECFLFLVEKEGNENIQEQITTFYKQ